MKSAGEGACGSDIRQEAGGRSQRFKGNGSWAPPEPRECPPPHPSPLCRLEIWWAAWEADILQQQGRVGYWPQPRHHALQKRRFLGGGVTSQVRPSLQQAEGPRRVRLVPSSGLSTLSQCWNKHRQNLASQTHPHGLLTSTLLHRCTRAHWLPPGPADQEVIWSFFTFRCRYHHLMLTG